MRAAHAREERALSTPTLPSRFEPGSIETRWQSEWDRAGIFRAPDGPGRAGFSLVLPPPNVTGVLTLGHMLGDTVMDVLARHHRMRGEATLWVPAVDHAGLATQVEVRRRLQREGTLLEELPREEALAEIERWKTEHERRILEQIRAGGFSVDWSRYRYTMDPASVRATREVFVTLFRAGLVYRGERLVNWDPRLRTASPTSRSFIRRRKGISSSSGIPGRTARPAESWSPPSARRRSSAMLPSRSIRTTSATGARSAGTSSSR